MTAISGQLTVTVTTYSKEVANNTNLGNLKYFTKNNGNNFGNLGVILAKIGCESNYNLRQLTESRVTVLLFVLSFSVSQCSAR